MPGISFSHYDKKRWHITSVIVLPKSSDCVNRGGKGSRDGQGIDEVYDIMGDFFGCDLGRFAQFQEIFDCGWPGPESADGGAKAECACGAGDGQNFRWQFFELGVCDDPKANPS